MIAVPGCCASIVAISSALFDRRICARHLSTKPHGHSLYITGNIEFPQISSVGHTREVDRCALTNVESIVDHRMSFAAVRLNVH
jgi:hypothetical protein